MKSPVVKRSIIIGKHKTSVSLEEAFWRGLKDIAASRRVPLRNLVTSIDTERQHGNLSSAIRLFVLDYYQMGMASPNRSFVAADRSLISRRRNQYKPGGAVILRYDLGRVAAIAFSIFVALSFVSYAAYVHQWSELSALRHLGEASPANELNGHPRR